MYVFSWENIQVVAPPRDREARRPPSIGDPNGVPTSGVEAAVSRSVEKLRLLNFCIGPT